MRGTKERKILRKRTVLDEKKKRHIRRVGGKYERQRRMKKETDFRHSNEYNCAIQPFR
jgi:hypothetical protein